jgi:hypothetical protein
MPTTFTKIASVTVGSGGTSSIAFSSIPSTYTDLCVSVSVRTSAGGTIDNIYIGFNSSSTGYTLRWLGVAATSPVSYTEAAFGSTKIHFGYMPGSTATSNTFGSANVYIPNYAGSVNKSVTADAVNEGNITDSYMGMTAGLWSNTSAITSIQLTTSSGTIAQYSTATLYGIKNS